MKYKRTLITLFTPLLLAGCVSYDKSIYLRNDEILEMAGQDNKQYEYRIMPNDELTITVSTSDPEASVPFYRKLGQAQNTQGMNNAKLLDYLVDKDGYIDYPVLGKLHVSGLSTRECEALISKELQKYLNESPNVAVRTSNYTISVLGEVNKPGTYAVNDERVNIFEALALAGDMTLFSVRDDVQLLREDSSGKRQVVHLDLTTADIATSQYYYLQQNDIVYVKPTKSKVRSNTFSNNSTVWINLLSLASAIASLIIVAVIR